jgi:hypothetical protein
MRTIPAALAWEFLKRGRWWLPGSALAAILPSLVLFSALQQQGAFQPADPQMIMIQSILIQVGMMSIGASGFTALGPYSRLFARPISSPGIALAQLLPAGLVSAAIWATATLVLNASLPLDWPILGPSLFVAVAVPAIIATFWLTDKSFWMIPSFAGVGAVLGLWFRSQFGSMIGSLTHLWRDVTFGDFLFLLCVAGLSGFAAVCGISRQRRQEPFPALDFARRLEWLLDLAPSGTLAFQSPERAQIWSEHRRRGWILPGLSLASSLVVFAIWLVVDRNRETLLQVVTGSGITLAVMAGLIGAFGCTLGPAESNWSIGPFLGTRPISSPTLARCVMWVQFRSVALATMMWLIAFLAAYVMNEPRHRLQQPALLIVTLLVCPWISAGVGSTIALTGRAQIFGAAFVTAMFAIYGFAIAVQLIAPRESRQEILNVSVQGIVYLLSSAVILGTIWAFARARRRGMIDSRSILTAAAVTFALGVIAIWGLRQTSPPVAVGFLVAAAVALAVAPLAAAPLAVAWNRSR